MESFVARLRLAVVILAVGLAVGLGLYFAGPAVARLPKPDRLLGFAEPQPHRTDPAAQPEAPAQPETPPSAPGLLAEGTQEVPILMYHDVTPRPSVYFDVSVSEFRKHLEMLRDAGATVISLDDLYDHLRAGKMIPPRSVVLTFDDCYLGQFEHAYPLLKEFGYPATFFIHTGVVGIRTSRDHMTWEQLQTLDKEGLVRVECHTVSHPDDMRKLSDEELHKEIVQSKEAIEDRLGREVRFFCYPVGNADSRVAQKVRDAGCKMALTMGPDWSRSPEDAFMTPRIIESRIGEVVARLQTEDLNLAIRPRVLDLEPLDLETGFIQDGQVQMRWVRGGRLSTVRLFNRKDVPTILRMLSAPVGLNGTFFSDANVNSQGAGIVGPVLNRFGPEFAPGLVGDRPRIAGRPMLIVSPTTMAFLPFRPHLAPDEAGIKRLVPDATDCFIGGGWLIHRGMPLTRAEQERFQLANMWDFRARAFVGIDNQGRAFLGATATSNQTDRVAETVAKLGLEECILLDSGFSTSLTIGSQVAITGLSRKDIPARPVPHALVLHPIDPATGKEVLAYRTPPRGFVGPPHRPTMAELEERFVPPPPELAEPDEEEPRPKRRKHRRR